MVLPEEFKKRVLKLYAVDFSKIPEDQQGRKLAEYGYQCFLNELEEGDPSVGEELLGTASKPFSAEDIVKAYEDKEFFDELYKEAQERLEAKQLYEEYRKLRIEYNHGLTLKTE